MDYKCIFLLIVSMLFISCDGGIKVKIYSYESDTKSAIFYKDSVPTGIPLGKTNVKIYLAKQDSISNDDSYFDYEVNTDKEGQFQEHFAIPPMKKEKVFLGCIISQKNGYVSDTLYFKHSSVDSIFCIINLKKKD